MVEPVKFIDYGIEYWQVNGRHHREDGPAVIYHDGTKFWYHHGIRHREDGPAIEFSDGGKQWILNGKELSQLEHFNRSPYFRSLTVSERVAIRLMIGR